MWPVLIYADSRDRCDSLSTIVGAIDRRICIECSADADSLVPLARCRHPLLAVISSDDTRRALRAAGALRSEYPDLPIIAEVAADLPLESLQALAMGVTDFLKRPVAPWEWQQRCRTLLGIQRQQHALQAALQREQRLRARMTGYAGPAITEMLARADVLHDEITGHHDRRTGRIAGLIAQAMGLSPQQCADIGVGASLHDIGKIAIPDRVLRKPTRYDDDDRKVMFAHPRIGHELLKNGASPALRLGAEIALTHHERYDGSGYPAGLAGTAIPLAGRITAVADVFDATTDGRIYRTSITPEQGLSYLREARGKKFDPDCVDALAAQMDAAVRIKSEPHPSASLEP